MPLYSHRPRHPSLSLREQRDQHHRGGGSGGGHPKGLDISVEFLNQTKSDF